MVDVATDSLIVIEFDKWEVVCVNENYLRLFLVQRAINTAVMFNEPLAMDVVEFCLTTEGLSDAFFTAVETDYQDDPREAYRAFKAWLKRIQSGSPD